ncbi:MAG: hypothetical protein A2675_00065 [Candidatus Yonathbacteria bacterium RIFCSPHIGHO2_01_FULL_51_10]|uniref:TraC-like domain-containing protein n=1 Tax=Candidatus Yonathbacteria bacterium RIFCSPHIGHO2_01_FULL_51_10 TaxID=1802723 RepID=A0A1G2S9N0_9BACT|nr:MAG: hypothetical protein A2675_00065 [Candidatus Yonathbacteria bacterium RIFCSPHIGHO2_01_FULL_51_10]
MAISSKSAQEFIPIKEIRDGIVILKNGELRLILLASSVNFALKSSDEQMAIIMQFQNFLNSLDFSVQIFIQSRRLDIRPYLSTLSDRLGQETNEMMRIQIKEYIDYVRKLTENQGIMTKTFFVIVPYGGLAAPIQGIMRGLRGGEQKQTAQELSDEAFEESRSQLEQRANIVRQGLGRTGVRVEPLGTEAVTELYYKIFNPGEVEKPVKA